MSLNIPIAGPFYTLGHNLPGPSQVADEARACARPRQELSAMLIKIWSACQVKS